MNGDQDDDARRNEAAAVALKLSKMFEDFDVDDDE